MELRLVDDLAGDHAEAVLDPHRQALHRPSRRRVQLAAHNDAVTDRPAPGAPGDRSFLLARVSPAHRAAGIAHRPRSPKGTLGQSPDPSRAGTCSEKMKATATSGKNTTRRLAPAQPRHREVVGVSGVAMPVRTPCDVSVAGVGWRCCCQARASCYSQVRRPCWLRARSAAWFREDTEDMNRERAETHLRLLAEADLR